MRMRRAHKAQPVLTFGLHIVGELATACQQGIVFQALDFVSAAKSGLDLVHAFYDSAHEYPLETECHRRSRH